MREIGRVINQAIANGNLTLEKIAAKVKCTQSYISQIRSGTKIPSNPLVRRLAEIFHEDADAWVKLAETARYERKYFEEDEKGGVKSGNVGVVEDPFLQFEQLLEQIKNFSDQKIESLSRQTKIRLSQELADLQKRLLGGLK